MKVEILVTDANVLIDFYQAKPKLLKILCSEFQVKIPKLVMDEIEEFTALEAIDFGMEIIDSEIAEPPLENISKKLSFQDKSCISLAKKLNASCLTNDKKLKEYLDRFQIKTYWGLEIILSFYEKKLLTNEEITEIGNKVFSMNPRFGEEVKKSFWSTVNSQE